ncbi:AraC family transcriptional regulator [Lachnoclostridium sp. Marseille-P6806]|uniref:AraC family transcriptional regulator n=1 Tax=Lachnoclostridium sp. Marseille-P6806 TaxID=2364793 RepID=UPI0013EF4EAF|nr:AraC family transcriptional regulator [Lachnoclostridium sp. Marseille-P6806]
MKKRYDSLDLNFTLGGCTFRPLNIVFEQFQKNIPRHRHSENCYEIHLIPAGKGTVVLEGHSYPAQAGTLFVTGPHIEHEQQTDAAEPMEEYCVFFHVSSDRRRGGEDSVARSFRAARLWIGRDTQGVRPIMERLFRELEEKRPGYTEACRSCLQLLVIAMARSCRCQEAGPEETAALPRTPLSDQKSIILDESFLYEYQTLTLDALARRLALSPRQTERLIRLQYGQTFQQRKTEARMNAASALLQSSSCSISSIADQLGYSSAEHFSNAFRRFAGVSPRRFREEARSRTEAIDSADAAAYNLA